MNNKLFYGLLLFLALLAAFYLYQKYRVAPSIKLQELVLTDLNEQAISIENFRGKKIVLSFGASWCGNCKQELNELKKIKDAELSDVEVIVISDEPIEKIMSFKEKNSYPFTFLKMQKSFGDIGINAIPTTYIINTNLQIKKEKVGYINWQDASNRQHLITLMQ